MNLLSSLNILPHEVLPSHLKTLRKMINLLILRCDFKLLWLAQARPKYIPFATIWRHYPYSCGLHGVDNRVVDVRGVMHLEA